LLANKHDADLRNDIRYRFYALIAEQKQLTLLFYTTNTLKKLKMLPQDMSLSLLVS